MGKSNRQKKQMPKRRNVVAEKMFEQRPHRVHLQKNKRKKPKHKKKDLLDYDDD